MPLSQKQMEYLALAWACMESEPKIDYEKFREVAGLASANSARELMRVTKKKLYAEYSSISESVHTAASKADQNGAAPKKATAKAKSASKTTKKQTKGKKVAASANADIVQSPLSADAGAEMEDDEGPPSKRPRTMSPNAESIKQEPDELDAEGDIYENGYHGF